MAYIFDKKVVKELFDKYDIDCDFSKNISIDKAIGDLAAWVCNDDNWLGAGVDRNAFCLGKYVIKVDKEFYKSELDDDENCEEDFESYNNIEYASSASYGSEQGLEELRTHILAKRFKFDGYLPKLFAATTNANIMILERCYFDDESSVPARDNIFRDKIDEVFSDIHDDNIAYNSEHELVVIDAGMGLDVDEAVKVLNPDLYYDPKAKVPELNYFSNEVWDTLVNNVNVLYKDAY